jgi:hypothetical protein
VARILLWCGASFLSTVVLESYLRAVVFASLLIVIAVPAFSDFNLLPEPESISLLSVGAIALLWALRRKK